MIAVYAGEGAHADVLGQPCGGLVPAKHEAEVSWTSNLRLRQLTLAGVWQASS